MCVCVYLLWAVFFWLLSVVFLVGRVLVIVLFWVSMVCECASVVVVVSVCVSYGLGAASCLRHHLTDMVVFSSRHRHGSPSRPSPRSTAASGLSHLLAVRTIARRHYARERSRAEHCARLIGCSQHQQQAPELPYAVPQPPISRTDGAAVFCPERATTAGGCLSLCRLLHFADGLPAVC